MARVLIVVVWLLGSFAALGNFKVTNACPAGCIYWQTVVAPPGLYSLGAGAVMDFDDFCWSSVGHAWDGSGGLYTDATLRYQVGGFGVAGSGTEGGCCHLTNLFTKVCITNRNLFAVGVNFALNGSQMCFVGVGNTPGSSWGTLAPGAWACFTIGGLTEDDHPELRFYDPGYIAGVTTSGGTCNYWGDGLGGAQNGHVAVSSNSLTFAVGGQSNGLSVNSGGSTGSGAYYSNTVPVVTYPSVTTNSIGAADSTLRTVGDALVQSVSDMTEVLRGALNGNTATISNQLNGVSSHVDAGADGVSNAIVSLHSDLTNHSGVGFPTGPWGSNYTSAAELAAPYSDPAVAGVDTFIGRLGSRPGTLGQGWAGVTIPVGGPSGPVMHVSFFEGEWSSVWALMRQLASYVLVVAYLMKVVKDGSEMIRTLGSARSTGVPNFAVAGTTLGAAAVPALIIGALAAYATCLAAFSALLVGMADDWVGLVSGSFMRDVGGVVGDGVGVLNQCFPLDLMFVLTWSYLVWRLTMYRALAIAVFLLRAFVNS